MAETLAAPTEAAKPEAKQESKAEKPIKRQMIGFTFSAASATLFTMMYTINPGTIGVRPRTNAPLTSPVVSSKAIAPSARVRIVHPNARW